MQKSLLITYFFPPKIGGIENYLWNICQRLPKSKSKVGQITNKACELKVKSQKLKVEDFDKIVVLADSSGFPEKFSRSPEKFSFSCSPEVSSPRGEAGTEECFKIYRTRFFSWKFFKPSWLPLIWKIWKIIKKEKIEILQFGHYAQYCLIGTFFKKISNWKILKKILYYDAMEHHSKMIIYIHGVDFWIHQKGWFGKWLMKLNFKNADKIIANSYFMKDEILKLGIGEEKVAVVTPGVDVGKFYAPHGSGYPRDPSVGSVITSDLPQDDRRDSHGIPISVALGQAIRPDKYVGPSDDIRNKKVILSLGRLIKLKGYDLVLNALPEVIKKVSNLIYLIVGEGEAEKELKNLTKKLNLEKYVIFVGAVKGSEETRAPYYALADVFVGPSREIQYKDYKHTESFGIVYLEAAAAGKPVIATKIGGIPEAVLDGRTGILIPPDDPQALTQALIKILTDKELAEKLGRQGRERVEREFNWEKQVGEIVKLLNG